MTSMALPPSFPPVLFADLSKFKDRPQEQVPSKLVIRDQVMASGRHHRWPDNWTERRKSSLEGKEDDTQTYCI